MNRLSIVFVALSMSGWAGCVIVNPAEVQVSASPTPLVVTGPGPSKPYTPYGPALERVLKQQSHLLKKVQKRDWKEVEDETADWTEYIRVLSGQADTSYDPRGLRGYCDQLLARMGAVREAAIRRDAIACERAIHACDPTLDRLARAFPTDARVVMPPVQSEHAADSRAPSRPQAP